MNTESFDKSNRRRAGNCSVDKETLAPQATAVPASDTPVLLLQPLVVGEFSQFVSGPYRSTDCVMELLLREIAPDTWTNIPAPVTDAVKAMMSSLLVLSDELGRVRKDLKGELEQTNARVRAARKEHQEVTQAMDDLRLHCREELHKGEQGNASTVRLAKEVLSLVQGNEKRRTVETAEIRQRVDLLELASRKALADLRAELHEQGEALSSKLTEQRSDVSLEVKAEVGAAANDFRAKLAENELGWKASAQKVHSDFRQWAIHHDHEAKTEKRDLNQTLQAMRTETAASLTACHQKIDAMTADLKAAGGEVYERVKGDLDVMNSRISATAAGSDRVHAELQQALTALQTNAERLRDEVQRTLQDQTKTVVSVRAELVSAQQCLLDQMTAKETRLMAEIAAACESVEARVAQDKDARIEAKLKDMKAKLAVSARQWLPLNLSDVAGMSPTEARLYTLEARQRTEENKHIQLSQALQDELDALKTQVQELKRRKQAEPSSPSSRLTTYREVLTPRCEFHVVPPLPDTAQDECKTRSVSPLNSMLRVPKSSSVLKSEDYTEHKVPTYLFSSPVSPPPGALSKFAEHETVRFEKLIT